MERVTENASTRRFALLLLAGGTLATLAGMSALAALTCFLVQFYMPGVALLALTLVAGVPGLWALRRFHARGPTSARHAYQRDAAFAAVVQPCTTRELSFAVTRWTTANWDRGKVYHTYAVRSPTGAAAHPSPTQFLVVRNNDVWRAMLESARPRRSLFAPPPPRSSTSQILPTSSSSSSTDFVVTMDPPELDAVRTFFGVQSDRDAFPMVCETA